jgi:TetR/AcrR family transcriptional regulator, ethionamide resistance regulator
MIAAMPPRQAQLRHSRQESRDRIVAAATELVRRQSYGELSIGAVMERAGFGRTIFYRHFDDLGDLLIRASRDAVEQLYASQRPLAEASASDARDVVRQVAEQAVAAFERHGPLLRAVHEAAASDPEVAAGYSAMRRQFDGLVERALRERGARVDDVAETARALNLLNEAYLLDAFGREPRVSTETAVQTVTEIWLGVVA